MSHLDKLYEAFKTRNPLYIKPGIGENILMHAFKNNRKLDYCLTPEDFDYLIDASDLLVVSPETYDTPLYYGLRYNMDESLYLNSDQLTRLIKGTNIDHVNRLGRTPLMAAMLSVYQHKIEALSIEQLSLLHSSTPLSLEQKEVLGRNQLDVVYEKQKIEVEQYSLQQMINVSNKENQVKKAVKI